MTPFETFSSVAAPMPDADIDTDIIFPARYLLLTDKHGLGRYAFFDKRYAAHGAERADFVLNRAPWRGARILVAGPNFGCGSSREQALWALADLGMRCIIAPGFGEIFRANCVANGILPIVLDGAAHARAMREAEAARPMTVDLQSCTLRLSGRPAEALIEWIAFAVPPRQRDSLLSGLDEIALILHNQADAITAFELRQRDRMPWLFPA